MCSQVLASTNFDLDSLPGEAYLFSVGGFSFILEFLLDFWKDDPVMLAIESLIPLSETNSMLFLEV